MIENIWLRIGDLFNHHSITEVPSRAIIIFLKETKYKPHKKYLKKSQEKPNDSLRVVTHRMFH
jgi:hypothetical protein